MKKIARARVSRLMDNYSQLSLISESILVDILRRLCWQNRQNCPTGEEGDGVFEEISDLKVNKDKSRIKLHTNLSNL